MPYVDQILLRLRADALNRFRRRVWLEAGTTAEALVVLFTARICVAFCFSRVAAWTLQTRSAGAPAPHRHLEARIGRSILRAARLLPGSSLCLPQAMAAKWMLERRGFPSTIHLGVGFRPAHEPGAHLHAHAWLEAGGSAITGADGIGAVTRLAR